MSPRAPQLGGDGRHGEDGEDTGRHPVAGEAGQQREDGGAGCGRAEDDTFQGDRCDGQHRGRDQDGHDGGHQRCAVQRRQQSQGDDQRSRSGHHHGPRLPAVAVQDGRRREGDAGHARGEQQRPGPRDVRCVQPVEHAAGPRLVEDELGHGDRCQPEHAGRQPQGRDHRRGGAHPLPGSRQPGGEHGVRRDDGQLHEREPRRRLVEGGDGDDQRADGDRDRRREDSELDRESARHREGGDEGGGDEERPHGEVAPEVRDGEGLSRRRTPTHPSRSQQTAAPAAGAEGQDRGDRGGGPPPPRPRRSTGPPGLRRHPRAGSCPAHRSRRPPGRASRSPRH